jgi:hypothetical protein
MIGPGPIAGDEDGVEGECLGASERDAFIVRRVAVFLRDGVFFIFLAVAFFTRTDRLLEEVARVPFFTEQTGCPAGVIRAAW